MNHNKQWSLLAIDIVGCTMVVVCLLGMLWFTTIQASQHSQEISRLSKISNSTNHERSQTHNQCLQQRAQLHSIVNNMGSIGELPESSPVEKYFHTLSLLAKQHKLLVLRHNPLTGRSYIGLKEKRFLYEVSGTFPDIVQFFKAVESTDYWADISYLKIDQGRGMYRSASKQRVAQMTISMFSSATSNNDNTDS